jgi:transcriptional regulator with XRE-family HTH domain
VAEAFGRNLLFVRRRLGFSQDELAKRCSLHRTEISLLKHGRRLARIDTVVKLGGGLGGRPLRSLGRDRLACRRYAAWQLRCLRSSRADQERRPVSARRCSFGSTLQQVAESRRSSFDAVAPGERIKRFGR